MSNSTYLAPYLNFNGNATEAMKFYHSIFGGELTTQTFGESGTPADEKYKDQLIHAQLKTKDMTIMASDMADHGQAAHGNSVNLSIVGDNADELTNWFAQLAEGGKVILPLEKQFWGDVFGSCTDRFGFHWMVNINNPEAKQSADGQSTTSTNSTAL